MTLIDVFILSLLAAVLGLTIHKLGYVMGGSRERRRCLSLANEAWGDEMIGALVVSRLEKAIEAGDERLPPVESIRKPRVAEEGERPKP